MIYDSGIKADGNKKKKRSGKTKKNADEVSLFDKHEEEGMKPDEFVEETAEEIENEDSLESETVIEEEEDEETQQEELKDEGESDDPDESEEEETEEKDSVENEDETKSSVQNRPIPAMRDLEIMNVHQLRRLAREYENFPIKGRDISKAKRVSLLDHFKTLQ